MNNTEFIIGDACNLPIKSESVDLIVTSPPYFGIDPYRYGGNYKKQINSNDKKMISLLLKSTKEMSRVIKNDGSILINIGNNGNMPYFYINTILNKTNLKLVNPPFIINYSNGKQNENKEKFNAYYGFWFHLSKNPHDLYYNPFIFKRYSNPIWDISWTEDSDIFSKLKDDGFLLDSFNSEIPKRFIEIFTKPNATVLDPFGGSGVTAIQAYKNNRNGISIDISEEQTELAKKRYKIEVGENYE
jgi:DNA modification methylase